jgi:hypothetical protein
VNGRSSTLQASFREQFSVVRYFLPILLLADAAALNAQAAPAPDRQGIEAALALFEGQDLEGQMLASAVQLTDASLSAEIEAMKARDIELPKDLEDRLRQLVFGEVKSMVDEMSPTFRLEAATIYASNFSVEELRELKRLQANPVMRKAEKVMPQMMVDIGKAGMKLSAERRPEIERKITEMVKEWLQDQALTAGSPAT